MTDPRLEEQVDLIKSCMETLKRFHDIFNQASLTETVVSEDEPEFQQLRKVLPEKWDSLFHQLGLKTEESVPALVELATSLSTVVTLTEYQRRKLYDLWHKSYMKLHYLLGKLQYRKDRLESLPIGRLRAKKFLASPFFFIILMLIALLVYLVLRQM
jgi:hypothetical protein